MKARRIHRFTLAEILVSMAVFSVLLVLLMQFFTGARTLWTANEKRSVVYSDAATILDFMSTLLQSTYCTFDATGGDQTPFEIVHDKADAHRIYFNSNSRLGLPGGSIRYLSFQRGTKTDSDSSKNETKCLFLKVFCDLDKDFSGCFYEYNLPEGANDPAGAREFIRKTLDGFSLPDSGVSRNVQILSRCITALEFTPMKIDGTTELYTKTPAAIKIKLSLMENEAKWNEWHSMPENNNNEKELKKTFREQNEYTFYRTVWLGRRD